MIEPRELPDTITPLSIPETWNALLLQWEGLGGGPRRCAVELKLAHVHLETGLKSCHCWNLGNVKYSSKHGGCWTFFACGEEVDGAQLSVARSYGAPLVSVVREYSAGSGAKRYSIKLKPPHPWTKFAAFESLREGVDRQLVYLRSHPTVLSALMTGDAQSYNDALHAAGYYTAGKAQYLSILKQRLAIVIEACRDLDWGDTP